MSRKVIIVGHVDHAHCSAIAAGLGMAKGVEIVNVETKKELEEKLGTDCSALFPPEIPIKNIDLESIKVPVVETLTETKRKGHERPYKYHR